MKSAAKSMADKSPEGGVVDAYVGRKALRKCGGIYVVSRRDGLVKVGITEGDFSRRFKELDQASRSAGIVGIQPEILVPLDEGMAEVESAVHQKLSANREGGEWFLVSTEDAVNAVLSAVVRQRVRNAKHRQCIQAGAAEKQQEDAGHPSFENIVEAALFAAQCISDKGYGTGYRVRALLTIATAQAEAGDQKAARKTGNIALSAARSIDKYQTDDSCDNARAQALGNVAVALAEIGEFDAAFSAARSIITGHREPLRRSEWDCSGREDVPEQQQKTLDNTLDKIAQIRESASHVKTPMQTESSDIAKKQAESVDIESALAAARNIDEADSRNRALRDIASAQAKAGDIDGAFTTARSINDADSVLSWNMLALWGIASAQAEAGDIDDALTTACNIEESIRDLALSDIASAQAKARNFRDAMKTAMEIKGLDTRVDTLVDIAKQLAARERD